MPTEFEAVFSAIPLLEGRTPDDFTLTLLAGYTNRNLRLKNAQQDWVLRIPQAATDRYIDRNAEVHNQILAHRLGIAPLPAWRNQQGVSLTATVSPSRTVTAADFACEEMMQLIVDPVQRLHRSGCQFRGQTNLEHLLNLHFEALDDDAQDRLRSRLDQAQRVLKLLETRDSRYVASHNDLVLDNLLLAPTGLWLIDWEYSAMSSPYWDLATLCNAANLDLEQSLQLLQYYCRDGLQLEEALLFDYRGLLQLLDDCWMSAHVSA